MALRAPVLPNVAQVLSVPEMGPVRTTHRKGETPMSKTPRSFPLPPEGYRKDGRPILPIRGAEDPPTTLEEAQRRIDSLQSDLVRARDRRTSAESREQEARRLLDERTTERDRLQQQANAGAGDVDRRIAEARTQAEQAARAAADAEWSQRLVQRSAELVQTRARQVAIDAGIRPEQNPPEGAADRVARFLALVDLQGVTGDDGAVNGDELATRVRNAAAANPEFVSASTAGGGRPGGYSAAPGSGQGATGGPPDQIGSKVDQALADMHKTLRIPPRQNAAT